MNGDSSVIKCLQTAQAAEGNLNLQYRQDWRSIKFMGAKKTAKKINGFGHDTHCWLRAVTDRIMELGGQPGYDAGKIAEAPTLTAALQKELALENAIVAPYEQCIQTAMKALDDGTRNLFEHLIKWHQKHIVWLEGQLRLIKMLGEEEYLAEKL